MIIYLFLTSLQLCHKNEAEINKKKKENNSLGLLIGFFDM